METEVIETRAGWSGEGKSRVVDGIQGGRGESPPTWAGTTLPWGCQYLNQSVLHAIQGIAGYLTGPYPLTGALHMIETSSGAVYCPSWDILEVVGILGSTIPCGPYSPFSNFSRLTQTLYQTRKIFSTCSHQTPTSTIPSTKASPRCLFLIPSGNPSGSKKHRLSQGTATCVISPASPGLHTTTGNTPYSVLWWTSLSP